jgi:hypothetical protein
MKMMFTSGENFLNIKSNLGEYKTEDNRENKTGLKDFDANNVQD